MKLRKHVAMALTAVTLGAGLLAHSSPASALPPRACEEGTIAYCLTYENGWAGAQEENRSANWHSFPTAHVIELAYYPNVNSDATILGKSGVVTNMWPRPFGVAATTKAWTIAPGFYCVRTYHYTGAWSDEFCLNDKGTQYWGGKYGVSERWDPARGPA